MTNPTGAAELPEALRLADLLLALQTHLGPRRDKKDPDEQAAWDGYTDAAACLRRLHAQVEALSAAQAGVPAGYALVPVEPTIAMCIAGDTARWNADDSTRSAPVYRAMLAAAPQPSPTPQADSAQDGPLQAFDSPRAKALMRAWEEGWAACRDAEYVGEEAQNDAFNSSHTLTLCIAEDQQLPAPQADSQPAVPTSATGGDWTQPTTIALRFGDAMQLLCGGKRPPDDMVQQWLDNTSESLQEFAASNGPAWAQGIGLIDAAMMMVDQPTEIRTIDNPDRDHEHRAARAPADSVTAPAGGVVEDCRRCHGSGEDPEGYYDQSRGDGGETLDGPCRECDGTGIAQPTPPAPADSVLEDAARWFAERDNVLQSFWVLLGEAEAQADNDNNPLLKHQVEGFYRQWNALNGTTLAPRWVTRAARKQGANHD